MDQTHDESQPIKMRDMSGDLNLSEPGPPAPIAYTLSKSNIIFFCKFYYWDFFRVFLWSRLRRREGEKSRLIRRGKAESLPLFCLHLPGGVCPHLQPHAGDIDCVEYYPCSEGPTPPPLFTGCVHPLFSGKNRELPIVCVCIMVMDETKKLVPDTWDGKGLVASHGAISSGVLAGSNGGGSTKAPPLPTLEGNKSFSSAEVRAQAGAVSEVPRRTNHGLCVCG